MSIFSAIRERIFGRPAQAESPPPAPASTTSVEPAEAGPALAAVPSSSPQPAPQQLADIHGILAEKARNHPEKLNWETSIVDLMKLLGLDSSLDHRKELARELNYSLDTNDSASLNVWLHREVMKKLAENKGQVPDTLR